MTLRSIGAMVLVVSGCLALTGCWESSPLGTYCTNDKECVGVSGGYCSGALAAQGRTTWAGSICTRNCSSDSDCGGDAHACVKMAGATVCDRTCSTTADCFGKTVCGAGTGADGNPTQQNVCQ